MIKCEQHVHTTYKLHTNVNFIFQNDECVDYIYFQAVLQQNKMSYANNLAEFMSNSSYVMHVSSVLSVLGGNYLGILLNDSSNCSFLILPPRPTSPTHGYTKKYVKRMINGLTFGDSLRKISEEILQAEGL